MPSLDSILHRPVPGPRPGGPRPPRALVALLGGLLAVTAATAAAPAPELLPARGFVERSVADVMSQEATLLAVPDASHAERWSTWLASEPRIPGTDHAARSARWLAERFTDFGLEARVDEYDVYLPHAVAARVSRLQPGPLELSLIEPAIAGDPDSADPGYSAAAGYSAAGNVTGAVVYANFGTVGDFAALRAMGVETRGAVVLMRFGQIFRGMKVRNAELAGAAAVLLYSDPTQDGFRRGEVYPDGPYRPGGGLERGSVKIGAPGDPTTPGAASLPGSQRVLTDTPEAGLPAIPVVALGYDAAARLLEELRGVIAPATWQGGLPLEYRLGAGEVVARVEVELDSRPIKRIRNPVAMLRGSERPDEWVIIGAHYDSWTGGAIDNASGTTALLEAARALGALARAGVRPRRSVVLAAWDAEEWGLIGSAEWAEQYGGQLHEGAVAYLNLDGIAGGPFFHAMASPSLSRMIREVAAIVPDPVVPGWSVLQGWADRSGVGDAEPPVALPGGGSDHAVFFGQYAIPSMSYGFAGLHGVYHSAYDTTAYLRRFGDPGYRQHTAVAAMTAVLGWRLANADLLPYDYRDYGRFLASSLRPLNRLGADAGIDLERLSRAVSRFNVAASSLERRAVASLAAAGGVSGALQLANRHLMRVERRLVSPAGIPGQPWYRNLVVAPHPDDAYVVSVFPSLWSAIGAGTAAGDRATSELAASIEAAGAELETAARLLAGAAGSRSADD